MSSFSDDILSPKHYKAKEKKSCKTLLYEKAACKRLMKSTLGLTLIFFVIVSFKSQRRQRKMSPFKLGLIIAVSTCALTFFAYGCYCLSPEYGMFIFLASLGKIYSYCKGPFKK